MSTEEMTESDRPPAAPRDGPHRLAADPAAPRRARAIVAARHSAAADELIDTAELLVSEVVTNVVRHTDCTSLELTVELLGDGVRVEVRDCDGSRFPEIAPLRPTEPGGVGMRIVDELATDWGARGTEHGKVVWFELQRGAASPGR
jgi:anti-sigma regulatory factor (Ser/Thr protein kinase)